MSEGVVLVVEDELVLQDAYKIILERQGYQVHVASNGLDGIRKLKKLRPRVVLLDVFMPVMSGKEFLNNIDPSNYPTTQIVVYSNLSDIGIEKEMLALGAHSFVVKSEMNPADLLALVDKHISLDKNAK